MRRHCFLSVAPQHSVPDTSQPFIQLGPQLCQLPRIQAFDACAAQARKLELHRIHLIVQLRAELTSSSRENEIGEADHVIHVLQSSATEL